MNRETLEKIWDKGFDRGWYAACARGLSDASDQDRNRTDDVNAVLPENENQETITEWGEETFGPTHPYLIARRMMSEVKELLRAFENVTSDKDKTALGCRWDKTTQSRIPIPVNEIPNDQLDELREECGDIAIMLDQVAELLPVELQDVKNYKMSINRGRRWAYCPAQQQTRHVEDFVEEGSGLVMKLDRWYVLSDSGSCYRSEGFQNAEEALDWIQAPEQCAEFGHEPEWAGIPPWDAENACWGDGGEEAFSLNVVYGRDLYDFWQNINKEESK